MIKFKHSDLDKYWTSELLSKETFVCTFIQGFRAYTETTN
jgi:hypothetical protein